MLKTRVKTMIYFGCAFALTMAGILYNGINFPLTNSFTGNIFAILTHITFVALSVGWVISVQRRIIDKRIRGYLVAVGLLMAFWLAERTIKWFFVSEFSPLCRYMWYAYYIPMILIPLFGVFITTYIGKPITYKIPKWLNILYIPAAALIIFVFTNDFHNLVFKFPKGIYYFNSIYEYDFGFYIVAAWFVILGFYFVITLAIKSRVPGSKSVQKLPLIIMACSVVFWLLYALGLVKADLTAVDCLMITLLLESAIQSGLIRSNAGYIEFFEISTVAAQVIDKNYQTKYISSYADDLPDDVIRSALIKPVDLGKTILYSKPVSGGYVLWQNDIRRIKILMKSLEETRERLSENNFLLKAENDMNEKKARLEEKNRLYDRIARDVSPQLITAEELLSHADMNPGSARNDLAKICVLSAFIKRRSNLLLLGEENNVISASELEFCLRESLNNIRLLGVCTSFNSRCTGTLNVENAVALYNLFEKTIELYIDEINALMVSLSCEDSSVKLNLQLGLNDNADISVLKSLALDGGSVVSAVDENDVAVYITHGKEVLADD